METRPEKDVAGDKPRIPLANPVPFNDGILLSREYISVIQDFTCAAKGKPETPWEKYVSDWLKDRESGAMLAAERGWSEVRLFFCSRSKRLMAFGAIREDEWAFQDDSPAWRLWILDFLACHTDFRNLPGDDPNTKFGLRLIAGMVDECEKRSTSDKIGLYVDPDNPAAKLYREKFDFIKLDDEWDEKEGCLGLVGLASGCREQPLHKIPNNNPLTIKGYLNVDAIKHLT